MAVATALALAACSSPAPEPGPTTAAAAPAPTSTSTSTTTTAPPPSPTTPSLPGLPGGTVLAVKIDNTAGARPRLGIERAEVVYVEPVEGGLTRLMAVFSTGAGDLPSEVGPIRSARETDVALLANWGRVALAYSGGSAFTRGVVDQANLASIPYDAGTQGYRRAGDRRAPYNVIGNTQVLLARAGTSATNGDPGFRFGPAGPGGSPAASVSTAWPASKVAFTWDAGTGRYLLTTDGRPDVAVGGARVGAATVVVQEVPAHLSENRDVNGAQTPVVDLVGSGPATVLRDGQVWRGQWARPDLGSPTSYTAGGQNGQPIPMASGPVWVLLVPAGQAVTVG
ncbi:MAG TPA: DUF3048 domain-containing protein [Lapillicoccus sp.]|nr:DUF3048 domain-containing protein [Lapillicoccus sp.]